MIMAPPIMENRIVFMRDSVSAIHHAAVDGVASTYQVEACEQLVRALQVRGTVTPCRYGAKGSDTNRAASSRLLSERETFSLFNLKHHEGGDDLCICGEVEV